MSMSMKDGFKKSVQSEEDFRQKQAEAISVIYNSSKTEYWLPTDTITANVSERRYPTIQTRYSGEDIEYHGSMACFINGYDVV